MEKAYGIFSVRRLIKATGYSLRGFSAAWLHETAFRQEVILTLVLVPLAIWLGKTGLEQALLVAVWLLVPLCELINSAIEAVVDRIGPEQHRLSGRAKDVGSAAVLLAIVNAVVVWALILAQ